MNFENNDVLANLFINATRSPQPSLASVCSPAARPSLVHSKSVGAEPSTPRRPTTATGLRVPRRSTISSSSSSSSAPHWLSIFAGGHPQQIGKTGGNIFSSPAHHHHRLHAYAGAAFTDSPPARAIPLPPSGWFQQPDESIGSPSSDTESISSYTSMTSISSSSASLPLSLESEEAPSSSAALANPFQGRRMTPLALIAAASEL